MRLVLLSLGLFACSGSGLVDAQVSDASIDRGALMRNAAAIVELANTASLRTLDDEIRLDSRAASNIVDRRPFADLEELDAVPYVGPSALDKLAAWVEAHAPEGELVHGIRERSVVAEAVLRVANEATEADLDDTFHLDGRAAAHIVASRPVTDLAQLDAVSYVGADAFASLARATACPNDRLLGYTAEGEWLHHETLAEAVDTSLEVRLCEGLTYELEGLSVRDTLHLVGDDDHRTSLELESLAVESGGALHLWGIDVQIGAGGLTVTDAELEFRNGDLRIDGPSTLTDATVELVRGSLTDAGSFELLRSDFVASRMDIVGMAAPTGFTGSESALRFSYGSFTEAEGDAIAVDFRSDVWLEHVDWGTGPSENAGWDLITHWNTFDFVGTPYTQYANDPANH